MAEDLASRAEDRKEAQSPGGSVEVEAELRREIASTTCGPR